MESFYHAYEAYERCKIRGEFYVAPKKSGYRPTHREPLLAQIGDLLIQTGLKLKRRYASKNHILYSPMMRSQR
jgi:hypothetical protein